MVALLWGSFVYWGLQSLSQGCGCVCQGWGFLSQGLG